MLSGLERSRKAFTTVRVLSEGMNTTIRKESTKIQPLIRCLALPFCKVWMPAQQDRYGEIRACFQRQGAEDYERQWPFLQAGLNRYTIALFSLDVCGERCFMYLAVPINKVTLKIQLLHHSPHPFTTYQYGKYKTDRRHKSRRPKLLHHKAFIL